jgi:hypothetical protein
MRRETHPNFSLGRMTRAGTEIHYGWVNDELRTNLATYRELNNRRKRVVCLESRAKGVDPSFTKAASINFHDDRAAVSGSNFLAVPRNDLALTIHSGRRQVQRGLARIGEAERPSDALTS